MIRAIDLARLRWSDVAGLVRAAFDLPVGRDQRARPATKHPALSDREHALYRAETRRRLRAATALAGLTVAGLSAVRAASLILFVPEHLGQMLPFNAMEIALGVALAALALTRSNWPPLPLAVLLVGSVLANIIHLIVFVPESRTVSWMALAMLPPAIALFLPWSGITQAAVLLAGAVALAAFAVSPVGVDAPVDRWIGGWLVLALSGLASVVGCVAMGSVRRRSFEDRMHVRRAHARTRAREADLKRLNAQLAHSSRTDALTGLGNRLRMNDELATAAARSVRYDEDCAVVLVDLDRFKTYNDLLGHVAGDAALRSVADALVTKVRAVDIVCRFGGEEFLIIMPGQTRDGALRAAERMRAAVEDLGLSAPTPVAPRPLTISAGVAILGRRAAQDPDAAVVAADIALYEAKVLGRNRVAAATVPPVSIGTHPSTDAAVDSTPI